MTSRPAARTVSAGDMLPTHDAIALVKGVAARACAARAAEVAWPDVGGAVLWIEAIPMVAHEALISLCPEVSYSRLANCLGLNANRIARLSATASRRRLWTPEFIAAVVQQVRCG